MNAVADPVISRFDLSQPVACKDKPFQGILIYEDQTSRKAAERAFEHLSHRVAPGAPAVVEEWSWEMFSNEAFRERIEEELDQVGVIVMAPGSSHRATMEVKLMIEAWLLHCAPFKEASVCLVYRNHDAESDWLLFGDYLKDLCAHRDVFYFEHVVPETIELGLGDSDESKKLWRQ